ncbi:secretin and TonB N-terminal domain-containing protein [Roseateles oligotrophus]|uniref:Secretin and TonB N-terminal domain-containing protein n=1 Tax=Roseateles oligotrophus TaxID=1769250 RepID=A0ABT2YC01_9BURK|nr:secretin and TonB N-terminal domain-containing protein [Roseateles oligotrophus]MCV2367310.1 secretin and TonB N-terminal domain-containing protein [Roseateles oligotrophus]
MTFSVPSPRQLACLSLVLMLVACAAPALRESEALLQRGEHEAAWRILRDASAAAPQEMSLRLAYARQSERSLLALATQAETARAVGQLDLAEALVQRMEMVDPQSPRSKGLRQSVQRARLHEAQVRQASQQLKAGQLDLARATVQQVLAEDPGQSGALALNQQLRQKYAPPPLPSALAAAFQKPISLEFRDAPLRTVFEAMARGAGVNFVFDKDVRGDAKVTIYLKDVTLDEAMRVILSTQQLERKLLNDKSVLIYPNTQAKQREHQELVTRSFYLNNADVKQAQALVRMMAKTRDIFIDERLNLLVARDTSEVIAMIEQLIAGLDLPEPEVMLDVEVLEIETSRDDQFGLQWPSEVSYGLPGVGGLANGLVELGQRNAFRSMVANPVLTAKLKGGTGASNVLANPKLRARNREKAKIQIGDKVPVFTSTSTANVGVSTSVTYIDVGLTLEVEPSIQLDNEVVMKVNLEVSNLGLKESSGGAQPTSAYRIGSRKASTSLRLRDGETQVLAGLISDEDRKSISGLPYLSEAPLLGRLFGVQGDNRKKTEIVLLITPRVLRNLNLPEASRTVLASGFDSNPGAEGARLRPAAAVALPMAGGGGVSGINLAAPAAPVSVAGQSYGMDAVSAQPTLEIQTTGNTTVGDTLSVTLHNKSPLKVRGEMRFDVSAFMLAEAGNAGTNGVIEFDLAGNGERVLVLRARPGSAGNRSNIELSNLIGINAQGDVLTVQVEGDAGVSVTSN